MNALPNKYWRYNLVYNGQQFFPGNTIVTLRRGQQTAPVVNHPFFSFNALGQDRPDAIITSIAIQYISSLVPGQGQDRCASQYLLQKFERPLASLVPDENSTLFRECE